MEVIHNPAQMQQHCRELRKAGKRIGLVPTMGALHQGHLSLLEEANRQADVSIMSIFVNPTQFGPREDFDRYPRPFEQDCAVAEKNGCDIVWAPAAEQMYPRHFDTVVSVERLSTKLEGAIRPLHFRGVTTVVLKLLNVVGPDFAVFGQKDAQQVVIIKRMIRDLNIPMDILVMPIVRDADGLAISSRNRYLTPKERDEAPLLHEGLLEAQRAFESGERDSALLRAIITDVIKKAEALELEYAEVVDTATLEPVSALTASALIPVACKARESATRLIDNIVVGGEL
jgi:pantoate--beta-alanine ligase